MIDKFITALDDVCAAVGAGDTVAQAVKDAAADHALPEHALLNRALRKIGNLEHFRRAAEEERIRAKSEAFGRGSLFTQRIDGEVGLYRLRNELRANGRDLHEMLDARAQRLKGESGD